MSFREWHARTAAVCHHSRGVRSRAASDACRATGSASTFNDISTTPTPTTVRDRYIAIMAPITTASNDETHAALLDTLDMYKIHKPFRNPNWKPPQRRNKNLKQILSEAQRAQQSMLNTQQNSGASTPTPATDGTNTPALNPNPEKMSQDLGRLVLEKNAKQSVISSLIASMSVPSGPRN